MSRPYGKMPRGGRKQPAASEPGEIQVNLTLRHSMEQLALEVQRALAIVQECGAAGVEKFRFRLLPLDEQAVPMVLRDRHGQPVQVINIPEEPEPPPYRENEPGIGVLPVSGPAKRADPAAKPPGAIPPRG